MRATTLLVACVAAASLSAQETRPTDRITFSFGPEGMPLETLIQIAEKETRKAFVYTDQQALKGKIVKMVGPVHVRPEMAFSFFQSVLLSQNFALVPLGDESKGLYLIDNIEQGKFLKQRATFVRAEDLEANRNDVGKVIMTTLPLRYASAAQIKAAVQQILANRSAEFIQEINTANSLLVVAFAPTVYAVKRIVDAMDVPQPSAELIFEIVELKHAVAEELQPIIADLLKEEAQGGQRRTVVNPETGAVGFEKPEAKMIADPRTNALVLYAVQTDVDEIKRLVAALDVEVTDVDNDIRIYMLKNTNAADLEEVLRDVLEQGNNRRGSRPSGVRSSTGQQPTSAEPRGQ
ncbi:MAG TPA: secretin N-terminal domain-containing protein, partial [Planctomycetota bacterium]|nr:secretin N-terminal domain-containing protein [Planctomycetota bacterium]